MSSKNVEQKNIVTHGRKHTIIGVVVFIILLVLIDLSPFGGNIRFYSKWIDCGQKPLIGIGSGFMNVNAQHYHEAETFQIGLRNQNWYCTPIEAERAGYSANKNSYEFPNLKAAGEMDPFEKKLIEEQKQQR